MVYKTEAVAVEKYDENGKPEEYGLLSCIHGHSYYASYTGQHVLASQCRHCWFEEQLEAGNLKLTRCPACGNNSYVEIDEMEYCTFCYRL